MEYIKPLLKIFNFGNYYINQCYAFRDRLFSIPRDIFVPTENKAFMSIDLAPEYSYLYYVFTDMNYNYNTISARLDSSTFRSIEGKTYEFRDVGGIVTVFLI